MIVKGGDPIKIDIALGKRVISFGAVVNKYSDPRMNPRYWPNAPVPFAHATDTFRNTNEQLKAYQGWVGDCVSLIAERVASIPLRLYDKNDELIKEHSFYDLMKHFNPDTTKFSGKEFISTYQDLTGECYLLMVKDGLGIPRELYFRSPARTSPVLLEPEKAIIGSYKYLDGMKEIIYPREDILFFRYPNPTDPFRGCSPVQRKAWAYDTDLYNMIYQRNVFKNGVHLKQVLHTDENLDQAQVDKILDIFDSTYGGIENTNKTGALVGGMKLETVGASNKDMQFMLLAKWTMQQIASAYHTPPQKLAHPEQTNLANMKALDVGWNRECIQPRLIRIAEVFNTFLIPIYKEEGLYCEFDNPVPTDIEFALKQRESDIKHFVVPINEVRAGDGKDPVPWGDKPLVPMNIMPLSSSNGKGAKSKKVRVELSAEDDKKFKKDMLETHKEDMFKRALTKLFQEQEIEVLRAIRRKEKLSEILKITCSEAEISEMAGLILPMIHPDHPDKVEDRCNEIIKGIINKTLNSLKKTLSEGIKAKENVPSLTARVTKVYVDVKEIRASEIARDILQGGK